MSGFLQRISSRISTVRRYSRQAFSVSDVPALVMAGVARRRPFSGSSAYSRVGRLLGAEVAPRVAAAGGQRVRLPLTNVVDLMVFEEIFVDGIYPVDEVPFEPETIIDAGACAGMFSLLAHAHFPRARLIAIEAEPRNFARFEANMRINGLSCDAHQAALWTADGTVRFSGDGFGAHIQEKSESQTIEVRALTLSAILREAPTTRLVLKMDIEGAERDVLPDAADILPRSTALFLETHHPEAEVARYLAPLKERGFSHKVVRRRPAPEPACEYVEHLLIRP